MTSGVKFKGRISTKKGVKPVGEISVVTEFPVVLNEYRRHVGDACDVIRQVGARPIPSTLSDTHARTNTCVLDQCGGLILCDWIFLGSKVLKWFAGLEQTSIKDRSGSFLEIALHTSHKTCIGQAHNIYFKSLWVGWVRTLRRLREMRKRAKKTKKYASMRVL